MPRINPPPPVRSPIVDQNGYCTPIWQAFFNTFYNSLQLVPTGTIWQFTALIPPDGWLICDGGEYSQKNYADLYSVIGAAFGSGDGTFKVPNLADVFIRGTVTAVGETGGAASFTITQDTLPELSLQVIDPGHTHIFDPIAHNHNIIDPKHSHSFSSDPHSHTVSTGAAGVGGVTTGDTSAGTVDTGSTTVTGGISSEYTGVTVDLAEANGTNSIEETRIEVNLLGGGQSISLLPPYVGLVYIIKY